VQIENPYEKQHRFLKAVRLVDALEELRIPVNTAQKFTQQAKLAIAANSDVGPPSELTWDTVVDLYRKRVNIPFQKRAMTQDTGSAFTQLQ
jgi:hypothetical protein